MAQLFRCVLLVILVAMVTSSLLIGVVTKDAVILSSNNVFSKNGVAMRGDFDWIGQLGDDCLVGVQGDSSDCEFLLSQLKSSNRDHQMTFGRSLPCRSVAHLCRKVIAKFLRSNQLKVSVLIAGWNSEKNCPSLFWLDSIGAIQEVPYAAHGEGFALVLGLLDRNNCAINESLILHDKMLSMAIDNDVGICEAVDEGVVNSVLQAPHSTLLKNPSSTQKKRKGALRQMTVEEGVAVVRSCVDAARKRTLGSLGSCRIKGVFGTGCRDLGTV